MADIFDEVAGSGAAQTNGDIFDQVAAPKKRSLGSYAKEEFSQGVKQTFNPSQYNYPGSETNGKYFPELRDAFSSLLGAARAAYTVPNAIGRKYVGEPVRESELGTTPIGTEEDRFLQMFNPKLAEKIQSER